jgi:carotenoid cleavage dioxygenase-like enzyme
MSLVGNRYLSGNFAPVTEELTLTDLPVTGTLPPQLDGRYLRNGPNPVVPPDPEQYHWFIGTGMVHGIRIRDGKAEWYRNRWVRNKTVAEALGEPWAGGPVHADMDAAPNTNVIGLGGRTFAIVEAGAVPYELTNELDTIGPTDFDGTLPGGFTAHPKLDPVTGELSGMAYFWGWDHVQWVVVAPEGRVTRTENVKVKGSPMMHDFSLTQRNVVIYDLPVTFNLEAAMAGTSFPYQWDDDYGARVGVMPRSGSASDVRWFDVDPCYVFHPMNSYDVLDGDDVTAIVLDVVRHPRMFDKVRNGPDDGKPSLWRWTIDTRAGKVHEEQLDDRPIEFPRVDERLVSLPHRYGYSAGFGQTMASLDEPADGLLKYDLRTGESTFRSCGVGSGSAEPVFVPSATNADEDDGFVMALVYDPARDASDLLVLNAQDFDGEPVAAVHLPVRVPFGFHGNWVPST